MKLVNELPDNLEEFTSQVQDVALDVAEAILDEFDPNVNTGDSAESETDEEDEDEV